MDELKEPRLKRGDHWLRLVIALVYFGLLFYLVRILVACADRAVCARCSCGQDQPQTS